MITAKIRRLYSKIFDQSLNCQIDKPNNFMSRRMSDLIMERVRFSREYDYIFYVSPDGVEIENNGVRETNAEYRDKIDTTIKGFCQLYNHRIKRFNMISGTTEERIKQIMEVISL